MIIHYVTSSMRVMILILAVYVCKLSYYDNNEKAMPYKTRQTERQSKTC